MQMTYPIELPSWLIPDQNEPAHTPVSKPSAKELKEEEELTFHIAFPKLMELVSEGYHLSSALREYHVKIKQGRFLAWVKRDPKRAAIYKESKELRSEFWADQLLRRASGEDGLNDVNRDKLFCDKLQWVMAADNRREYGNHTTVETHQSININAVLEQANSRVPNLGRIIDHDDLED